MGWEALRGPWEAMELLPEHVYVDDGDERTLTSAFERYRFCAFDLVKNTKGGRGVGFC